jgi:hypothetical protein
VRRIGLAGVLALALGGATRGAAEPPPPTAGAATAGALLLRAGGPSLVLAVGARIESVDPESGKTIGALTPVTVPGFTWRRFLRRGRFLLAEGRTDWTREPFWNATRGLVLLDETGRVRWTETHILTRNRASHAVFLDGEGNVAFDKLDQPQLIKPDGTRIDTSYPPAGPVLHGKAEVLPLKPLCAKKVDHWLAVNTQSVFHAAPSDDIGKQFLLKPTPDDRQLALVQTIDVAPEEDAYRSEIGTMARLPLPPVCRGARHRHVSETMSSRHWIMRCTPESDDGQWGRSTAFVIDVEARRLRRLAPPASDQSGVPREARGPDKVDATVMPDGKIIATVWNHCRTAVHMSTSGGGWKRSDVASDWGAFLAPEAVCGRLTLQTALPGTTHCSHPSGPATHVLRPDGSWLALPYAIAAPQSGSCSRDAEAVAFMVGDALTTARLDRDERRTVRAGLNEDTPLAWLP